MQEFYVSKQYQHLYQMKIFKNPQESDFRYLKITKNDQKEQKTKWVILKKFVFVNTIFLVPLEVSVLCISDLSKKLRKYHFTIKKCIKRVCIYDLRYWTIYIDSKTDRYRSLRILLGFRQILLLSNNICRGLYVKTEIMKGCMYFN